MHIFMYIRWEDRRRSSLDHEANIASLLYRFAAIKYFSATSGLEGCKTGRSRRGGTKPATPNHIKRRVPMATASLRSRDHSATIGLRAIAERAMLRSWTITHREREMAAPMKSGMVVGKG